MSATTQKNTYFENESTAASLSWQEALDTSWKKVTPYWPLENLIAVNPLAGFEDLAFDEALHVGMRYFRTLELSDAMQKVNLETIKWLQAFFDEGQATISMPLRHLGLFSSVSSLLAYDQKIQKKDTHKLLRTWHTSGLNRCDIFIEKCLDLLGIAPSDTEKFFSLLLLTLPGWASYMRYLVKEKEPNSEHKHHLLPKDYIALRLLLVVLFYPQGKELLAHFDKTTAHTHHQEVLEKIKKNEEIYKLQLLEKISHNLTPLNTPKTQKEAQIVFCIDVRSEAMRRVLEKQGLFETFGFAGFFGIPTSVHENKTGKKYASCPVLLKPSHEVKTKPLPKEKTPLFEQKNILLNLFQSLKYNLITPFALVESMGFFAFLMLFGKTFFPKLFSRLSLKEATEAETLCTDSIAAIPFEKQCAYAKNALRMMGLVTHFSPTVIFCGHGAQTHNNAYASQLHCGACAGRKGGLNASVLAAILNRETVRLELAKDGIVIPPSTYFLAAEHNTTKDSITLFEENIPQEVAKRLQPIKEALLKAHQEETSLKLEKLKSQGLGHSSPATRACDWAEVRPEWGLTGNASFIIGPRNYTEGQNLNSRTFLHSYDWEIDSDNSILATILTAPVIVAKWISCQYLFSTLDNTAFGAGSKITKNITGKIGVMQGNASDLMHGLPLQSVFTSDKEPLHDLVRLLVVVVAPCQKVDEVLKQHKSLQTLFRNRWLHLVAVDPQKSAIYHLNSRLEWNQ